MKPDTPELCIACKQPGLVCCTTDAARREFAISKLCEPCWREWVGLEEDEEEVDEVA